MKTQVSKIWESNISDYFESINDEFIGNFRSIPGSNKKLTSWSPVDKTSRWFKFLLFNSVKQKNNNFFELYKKIKLNDLGSPVNIRYNGLNINLDYFLSIEEYLFVYNSINQKDTKIIVEIGSGFGRTCHTFLELNQNIEQYFIIDLPEMLKLSSKYLNTVLSKSNFDKIKFVSNEFFKEEEIKSDLVLNINSFQEMYSQVIDEYFNIIIQKSRYFYSRNAVCKYSPESVNLENTQIQDVYELGYCTELIDIFDNLEIENQVERYKKIYKPINWTLISDKSDLFPYYHNVLYKKW